MAGGTEVQEWRLMGCGGILFEESIGGRGIESFLTESFICEIGGFPAPRSSLDESLLDKEGFVDFFDSTGIFINSNGECTESDGAAFILFDNSEDDIFIHFVETELINLESV